MRNATCNYCRKNYRANYESDKCSACEQELNIIIKKIKTRLITGENNDSTSRRYTMG